MSDRLEPGVLCPALLKAMAVLGKRWNGLIVQALGGGTLRFTELRRSVPGISDAVLSRRLAELQGCALLERDEHPDGRTHGSYTLTDKGRGLLPVLDALTDWAERWAVEPGAADPGPLGAGPVASDEHHSSHQHLSSSQQGISS